MALRLRVPISTRNDVCECAAAACVRPQSAPAVRITAGTWEDFKKGTQTGLRPLAPEHWPLTQTRGPQQPLHRLIKTVSL